MKISGAIERADELRPNAVADHLKAEWLFALDGELAELFGLDEAPDAVNYPEADAELLMPYPKDNIYPLYLMAMIDNANEETALYANDMTVAMDAIQDAKRWVMRTLPRPEQGPVRCL